MTTKPTTEAGKRAHDMRHLPEFCSDPCPLRQELAAIEAEAVNAALDKVEAAHRRDHHYYTDSGRPCETLRAIEEARPRP